MAGIRFELDLFIPESIYNSISATKKIAIRDRIRELKYYATNLPNEVTVRAVWHKCYHDESPNKSCEVEQEI